MTRTETMPNSVAEWLHGLEGVFDAVPLSVQIGKAIYPAARYQQRLTAPENSEAWRRGGREYVREMIYCVGARPAAYVKSGNTCFRFIGDDRDWYIAGYVLKDVASDPRYAEFHPFGEAFQLAPWSVPDGTAIDHYEPRPYARVGASFFTWSK